MNREDLNWRKLNLQTAVKTINQMLDCQSTKAFVLDDSIKIRHGKKMPGVSSHFDHTLGPCLIRPSCPFVSINRRIGYRLNSYCFEVNQRLMLVVQ
jgi:hypothetical protein